LAVNCQLIFVRLLTGHFDKYLCYKSYVALPSPGRPYFCTGSPGDRQKVSKTLACTTLLTLLCYLHKYKNVQ